MKSDDINVCIEFGTVRLADHGRGDFHCGVCLSRCLEGGGVLNCFGAHTDFTLLRENLTPRSSKMKRVACFGKAIALDP